MSDIKALLEKRRNIRRKKPLFIRKDIYKKGRVGSSWRRPRGLDNKQRLCKRGPAKKISNGYRAPKEVRGFHKSGLIPVVVSNVSQLSILTKEQGVILSAKIGNRKRQLLINEAKKKNLVLLNLDADKTLEKIQAELKQRQELRRKSLETDKEKKKSIEEKVKKEEAKIESHAEARKEEPQLSDEEKKKLEKEEKDKLLTKRE